MNENWTELKIKVPAPQADIAGAIANMVVPYGIYMEDYSHLEEEALEIAHIDLIDEELLQKDREHAIIHIYISPEANPAEAVSFLEERQKALGPWKREEKIMGVIMILTVLSWVLKSVTNIPEYATALIALCATLIFGILPVKQWRNNVAWESLIFIACSVGLGTVLPHVNITTWLSEAVGPYTVGFFSNPFLLIAGLAVLTLLVRFLILSEIGYLSVFTALLIPLGISAGINPWIIGFILNAFVIGWFLPYQSSVYLTAIYAAGEGWVTIKDTTKYCYVYCIIGLVCMYIAYFLWNLMGIWSIA